MAPIKVIPCGAKLAVMFLLLFMVTVMGLAMPLASLLTWAERRQSAMMQDRLGPNRANIGPIKLKGILHFVADAVKMIFKEDFIPANVHKRDLHMLHFTAWKRGMKSLYYCRSTSIQRSDKVSQKLPEAIQMEMSLKAKPDQYDECLACQ